MKIYNLQLLLMYLWIRQLRSWTWPIIPVQNCATLQQTEIEWIHTATQWALLERQVQATKSLVPLVQQPSKPGLSASQTEHSIYLPWSGILSSYHGNPESRPRCPQRVPSRCCEQFSLSGPNGPLVQSRYDWCWSPVSPADVGAHPSRYCCTTRMWSKVQCCNTNTRQWNKADDGQTDAKYSFFYLYWL